MLNVIRVKGVKFVSLVEFYDYIFGSKPNYYRWVRHYVTDSASKMPKKGRDYIDLTELPIRQGGAGNMRKDYLITIDFLKQLCFDIKTKRCKSVHEWANSVERYHTQFDETVGYHHVE